MMAPDPDPQELFLRFYRWNMIVLFVLVVLCGTTLISSAVWPDSAIAHWLGRAPWYLVVAPLIVGGQQAWLRKHRLSRAGSEAKAIFGDEWRRANVARATRASLIIVLILQFPIAVLLRSLPTMRAVMAMAASTVTLGAALFVSLFLIFDRE